MVKTESLLFMAAGTEPAKKNTGTRRRSKTDRFRNTGHVTPFLLLLCRSIFGRLRSFQYLYDRRHNYVRNIINR